MPIKKTSESSPAAGARGITIRMYNSYFGDCFLLGFPADDGGICYILIDCGVYQTDKRGSARMKLIAKDIAKTTGSHLHVLAVTHEHADHIDGFGYAKDVFGKNDFGIDELWLAWTEDPDNPVAQKLKDTYGKKLRALQAAVTKLQAYGHPLAVPLQNLLNFDAGSPLGMASNTNIMKDLREWSKKKPKRSEDYRTPGEKPIGLPGVSGVRCYVLGPPMDVAKIGKVEDPGDMYGITGSGEAEAFLNALIGLDGKPVEEGDLSFENYPFNPALKISPEQAESDKKFRSFFEKHYGFADNDSRAPGWRRIDTDWVAAADQLALSLNNMTNNTSLVLAFELTGTTPTRFLLFVGDAQAGNWASWPQEGDKRDGWTVTSDDIKKRTIFYKVGHHGSRNATYREKGLEMMESDNLVAMIPVDEEWAYAHPPLHHPDQPVLERLLELTKGRVLRSDKIPDGDTLPKPDKSSSDAGWDTFAGNVDWDRSEEHLWIQYTVR
jgi:beta-lactamase superfamily II metal-dependent hydrolase